MDAEDLARSAQLRHGLPDSFFETLRCESGFRNRQSEIPDPRGPNGYEDSWGIAQIHLPDHPNVTRAQALDPAWAAEWAAEQFAAGNAHLWTCYRGG